MLFLLLRTGEERWALEAKRVVEVVPRVRLSASPLAPPHVVGLLDFRGEAVPVVDLRRLVGEDFCLDRLSSRIVIVEYLAPGSEVRKLGLLAEQVTDTVDAAAEAFSGTGLSDFGAPWMGGVTFREGESIRALVIERLLAEELRETVLSPYGAKES